jgi:hypothetical protein
MQIIIITTIIIIIIIIIVVVVVVVALQPFCWALAVFSVSLSSTQSVGLLGWWISRSQGLYLRRATQTE